MKSFKYVSVGLADQALASANSLLLSVAVLSTSTFSDAASFAVLILIYGVAVALSRGLTTEPLAVFLSGTDRDEIDGTHVLVSLFVASSVGGLAIVVIGSCSPVAMATLAGVVFATGSDAVRSEMLARRRSGLALIVSLTVIAGTGVGALLSFLSDAPQASPIGWGAGSAMVVIVALVTAAIKRSFRSPKPETWGFVGEAFTTTGASQGAVLLATALIGPHMALIARVAGTLYGPYQSIYQAISLLAVPALRSRTGSNGRKLAAIVSMVLFLAWLGGSIVAFAIATLFGDSLFGESWAVAEPYLPVYAMSLVAGTASAGVFIALRLAKLVLRSFWLRLGSGILQLVLPIILATVLGAAGFYLGSALVACIVAITGYRLLRGTTV